VDDMMDESKSYIGRWMKMMMKHVIAVVEKGMQLIERIRNIKFFIYGH
jgi:hypothetical protein